MYGIKSGILLIEILILKIIEMSEKRIKYGGRVAGVKNKKHILLDALISELLSGGIPKFKLELEKLKGKDYVTAIIKLSKLTSITPEFSKATELLTKKISDYETC